MSQEEKDIAPLRGKNSQPKPPQSSRGLQWRRLLLPPAGAFVLVTVVMLLATQFRGAPTGSVQTMKQVASPISASALVPVSPTVPVVLPTVPPGAPIRFERDEEGYRLYADKGVVYYGKQANWDPWISPTRLLVTWLAMPRDGNRVHEAYILNLDTGALEQLPGYQVHMAAYASKDGSRVALLDLGNDRILLSDLRSGEVSKISDREANVSQWAGEALHPAGDDFLIDHGSVTWVSPDAFVVDIFPDVGPSGEVSHWADTLLMVDIPGKRAHLLAPGFLEGALPDGTILLSQDSPDGTDLFALQPPYTGELVPISEPGAWIGSVAVSPDGAKVAWLEAEPELKDLANQHELCFEGCGFRPTPKAIAIWEPGSGQLKRLFVAEGWRHRGLDMHHMYLAWSKDNAAIFYHILADDRQVGLYKLAPDGSTEELVKSPAAESEFVGADSLRGITFLGEANDGSIYYSPPGDTYVLVRRNADGTTEVLAQPELKETWGPAVVDSWLINESRHVLILNEDGATVIDLASGEHRKVTFPAQQLLEKVSEPYQTIPYPFRNVRLSPDGRWLAYAGWDDDQYEYFSLEGLPDPGLVLRVVEVK
ncbi:MAG TPA: hypothetical protein VF952_15460 [Chloroflexia bacterium]